MYQDRHMNALIMHCMGTGGNYWLFLEIGQMVTKDLPPVKTVTAQLYRSAGPLRPVLTILN